MSKHDERQRSSADMPSHVVANNPSLGNLSREDKAHGEGRAPRRPMNTGDFNLHYPENLMKADKKYYWFADDGKGRLDAAKAAWWDHVIDEQGVNYSALSGGKKMYLMSIDKKYFDEDEKLREANYRASIGDIDSKPIDAAGLEHYVPSGTDNKIKVTSDPFAS